MRKKFLLAASPVLLVMPAISFVLLHSSSRSVTAEDQRLIVPLLDISIANCAFGYNVNFTCSEFLPYDGTEERSALVFGLSRATLSETLRSIVSKGVDAVPALLKHIDDERKIDMEPVARGMGIDFRDEYDFNPRTRESIPEGVNRNDLGKGKQHPDQHTVTVGDLCFVALGQIVNRQFSATRYHPSEGLIINSPTHSQALREVIIEDWQGLTKERHKKLLIEDFTTPDHEDRRIGAYRRLAFYYPELVEELVLDELSKPTFDVLAVHQFCRDTLYKIHDKAARQRKYDEFIREHGTAYSPVVMDQLFDDLILVEAQQQQMLSPQLTLFGAQPRELLIQLFAKPTDVKSSDRPFTTWASEAERARLIRALIHDDSQKIGDLVKKQFRKSTDDDSMASACLRCLATRGYADFLIERLEMIDVAVSDGQPLDRQHFYDQFRAISHSRNSEVQAKLLEVVKNTRSESMFMSVLPKPGRSDDELILKLARELLIELPDEIDQGGLILAMIRERFPKEAKSICESFLATGSAERAATVCGALWGGDPLSQEVLPPLLDDQRPLTTRTTPLRVCDLAAQAISYTTEEIDFDFEWSSDQKDLAIEKLKEYCRETGR